MKGETYYFLDNENIHYSHLIANLNTIEDRKFANLVIFAKSHLKIEGKPAKTLVSEFKSIQTEDMPVVVKNGVDFGIVVAMTLLAAKNPDSCKFVIISNDKSFDAAIIECERYLSRHSFLRMALDTQHENALYEKAHKQKLKLFDLYMEYGKKARAEKRQEMISILRKKKIDNPESTVLKLLSRPSFKTFIKNVGTLQLKQSDYSDLLSIFK